MKSFIEANVLRFRDAIESIGGEFEDFEFDEPSDQEEIDQIESKLGLSLPKELKDFARSVSGRICFDWTLPEGFELPDSLSEISSGGLEFDISAIPVHERGRADWLRECFSDPEDAYSHVWHDKIAIHGVPNGDLLAVDSEGAIIYLSHDGGEGHGCTMAACFTDLIKSWLPLGCPGPEDWQWLPFVSSLDSGISCDVEPAREWLKLLSIEA